MTTTDSTCCHPDATDCHWSSNGNAHEFAGRVAARERNRNR
ncbi:hypothetical protein GCM10017786_07870 [Amycolatopsis deserti]|uniref:DUF1059 domain-containing protein n=1 Tax=Amycolatopsis deserti TaxID=185696 RepID=A0ABQ3IDF6_9PSEU|nr:hypothetical protein [Amycolatopsis deserti]GHE80230.1 hypothetical protein GCM10017786_07870 [Amycolatopsis deserti]